MPQARQTAPGRRLTGMRDMYLWFSVIGWAAVLLCLFAMSLMARRKRQR